MDTQNSIVITHVPSMNDLVVEIVFMDVLVREAARIRRKWEGPTKDGWWWRPYQWEEVSAWLG